MEPPDEENKNFLESLFEKYKNQILILFLGVSLVGLGIFVYYKDASPKIEVLQTTTESQKEEKILVVEISGAVLKPGVYKVSPGSRVEDLILAAGGLSVHADRNWIEKNLNRAAKISDGQKIYVFSTRDVLSARKMGEDQSISETQGSGLVNINTSSQKELESLTGIGPVYAQNIIEQRPYSNIEELLSRKVLTKNVYEKIKDKISVY